MGLDKEVEEDLLGPNTEFDAVLQSKIAVNYLKLHLEVEFSRENWDFWEAVNYMVDEPHEQRKWELIRDLIEEFVPEDAPRPVNIMAAVRDAVLHANNQNDLRAVVTALQAARQEVRVLMSRDSFKRFKTSELWIQMNHDLREERRYYARKELVEKSMGSMRISRMNWLYSRLLSHANHFDYSKPAKEWLQKEEMMLEVSMRRDEANDGPPEVWWGIEEEQREEQREKKHEPFHSPVVEVDNLKAPTSAIPKYLLQSAGLPAGGIDRLSVIDPGDLKDDTPKRPSASGLAGNGAGNATATATATTTAAAGAGEKSSTLAVTDFTKFTRMRSMRAGVVGSGSAGKPLLLPDSGALARMLGRRTTVSIHPGSPGGQQSMDDVDVEIVVPEAWDETSSNNPYKHDLQLPDLTFEDCLQVPQYFREFCKFVIASVPEARPDVDFLDEIQKWKKQFGQPSTKRSLFDLRVLMAQKIYTRFIKENFIPVAQQHASHLSKGGLKSSKSGGGSSTGGVGKANGVEDWVTLPDIHQIEARLQVELTPPLKPAKKPILVIELSDEDDKEDDEEQDEEEGGDDDDDPPPPPPPEDVEDGESGVEEEEAAPLILPPPVIDVEEYKEKGVTIDMFDHLIRPVKARLFSNAFISFQESELFEKMNQVRREKLQREHLLKRIEWEKKSEAEQERDRRIRQEAWERAAAAEAERRAEAARKRKLEQEEDARARAIADERAKREAERKAQEERDRKRALMRSMKKEAEQDLDGVSKLIQQAHGQSSDSDSDDDDHMRTTQAVREAMAAKAQAAAERVAQQEVTYIISTTTAAAAAGKAPGAVGAGGDGVGGAGSGPGAVGTSGVVGAGKDNIVGRNIATQSLVGQVVGGGIITSTGRSTPLNQTHSLRITTIDDEKPLPVQRSGSQAVGLGLGVQMGRGAGASLSTGPSHFDQPVSGKNSSPSVSASVHSGRRSGSLPTSNPVIGPASASAAAMANAMLSPTNAAASSSPGPTPGTLSDQASSSNLLAGQAAGGPASTVIPLTTAVANVLGGLHPRRLATIQVGLERNPAAVPYGPRAAWGKGSAVLMKGLRGFDKPEGWESNRPYKSLIVKLKECAGDIFHNSSTYVVVNVGTETKRSAAAEDARWKDQFEFALTETTQYIILTLMKTDGTALAWTALPVGEVVENYERRMKFLELEKTSHGRLKKKKKKPQMFSRPMGLNMPVPQDSTLNDDKVVGKWEWRRLFEASKDKSDDDEDGANPPGRSGGAGGSTAGGKRRQKLSHIGNSELSSLELCYNAIPSLEAYNNPTSVERPGILEQDGFVLDMSYITDHVIAMAYPWAGAEGVLRSHNIKDVRRYLRTRHPQAYKLYNLCAERQCDHTKFEGNVITFPFDSHTPCFFELIPAFCEDARLWLTEHPQNVIAVHCKQGRGRTGMMIACYLLYSNVCATAEDALLLFGSKRCGETQKHKGVSVPSQIRYVKYFDQYCRMLRNGSPAPGPTTLFLSSIVIHTLPRIGSEITVVIKQSGKNVETSTTSKDYVLNKERGTITFDLRYRLCPLSEDVALEFHYSSGFGSRLLFQVWFHTRFQALAERPNTEGREMHAVFVKSEIDKAFKDKSHKRFDRDLKVEVVFVDNLMSNELKQHELDACKFYTPIKFATLPVAPAPDANGSVVPGAPGTASVAAAATSGTSSASSASPAPSSSPASPTLYSVTRLASQTDASRN